MSNEIVENEAESTGLSFRARMLGVAIATAGLLGIADKAAAKTGVYPWLCCNLACDNNGPCWDTCIFNYHVRSWYCYYGSSLVGCHECTSGAACWDGTFKCSWWAYA
jgi:hypothetical protein